MGRLAKINAHRKRLDNLRSFDPLERLRQGIHQIATERREWAGIPMPIDSHSLVIEPTYPRAAELMAMSGSREDETWDDGGDYVKVSDQAKVRNRFWSDRLRSTIVVYEDHGRISYGVLPGIHHFTHDLMTLGASDVWGLEQEANAVKLLATLLPHHAFKKYLLTGMFLESSKRSGLTYMFRKLRPTVAISMAGKTSRILAALCLHPIAYYSGSWAGAMCPTDDVIAHLMLMRGDEPMFWRRANQHHPVRPEAGL